MKQTIKICALWVLVLVLAILPVVTLIGCAVMNDYGTFGWALHIAVSLVFITTVVVALGKSKNATRFFLIETLAGSAATMFTIGIMSAFCSQMNWYNPQPTAWMMAYAMPSIAFAMFHLASWRNHGGIKQYLFWCGFALFVAVAAWCIPFAIVGLCGAEMPKICEDIFGAVIGLIVIAAAVRIVVACVGKAVESGMAFSARCLHSCIALFCASLTVLISYAMVSRVMDLPYVVENACMWLMGAGFIGMILSIIVVIIECYIDERKRKVRRG